VWSFGGTGGLSASGLGVGVGARVAGAWWWSSELEEDDEEEEDF
jgi:hypothetical protein